MRVLFINICVAVVALVTIRAESSEANDSSKSQQDERFPTAADGKNMTKLMNKHLQDSLTYLFTSKQYGSQYWERPGMAKYLMELSDKEWEAGLDTLKKYMQRGGKIEDFRKRVHVNAAGKLDPSSKTKNYMMTSFKNIHKHSLKKFNMRNELTKDFCHRDAEICYFLKEGLAKEAERMYELKSYQTIATSLNSTGVGLSLFDASL